MELKPSYKKTEAGAIPNDWECLTLSELGSFKNGINKPSKDFGHGSPFVNLMDVFGTPTIDSTSSLGLINSTSNEQSTYDLVEGDALFIRSSVKPSGVGLTALISRNLAETVFSGFLIRFRSDRRLDNTFKRYCFHEKGFRSRVISNSTVSANTNINQTALGRLALAFPKRTEEQRAIATALSDVDALLAALDRLIAKKRDVKTAAMQQLLTGRQRLPGFSGAWDTTTLGELGDFSKGRGIRRTDLVEDGLPCVRYGELYTLHENVVRDFGSFIPQYVAAQATRLQKGDILFAGSGETKEDIGMCAAFTDDVEAYAGGDIVILTPQNQDSAFLGYLLNAESAASQKASMAQGDAVVHISARNLAQLMVQIPSRDEQNAIATVASDMDAEIAALEARRDKTKHIKQGMMQELLTGKTRLVS